jgi:hypothetical protein
MSQVLDSGAQGRCLAGLSAFWHKANFISMFLDLGHVVKFRRKKKVVTCQVKTEEHAGGMQ